MKSKEEIIACLEDEIKWRDKVASTSHRFDTFEQYIHQGWCEALEWVLHKTEPITTDEYSNHKEILGTEQTEQEWTCINCNNTYIDVIDWRSNSFPSKICQSCDSNPGINFTSILEKKETK